MSTTTYVSYIHGKCVTCGTPLEYDGCTQGLYCSKCGLLVTKINSYCRSCVTIDGMNEVSSELKLIEAIPENKFCQLQKIGLQKTNTILENQTKIEGHIKVDLTWMLLLVILLFLFSTIVIIFHIQTSPSNRIDGQTDRKIKIEKTFR